MLPHTRLDDWMCFLSLVFFTQLDKNCILFLSVVYVSVPVFQTPRCSIGSDSVWVFALVLFSKFFLLFPLVKHNMQHWSVKVHFGFSCTLIIFTMRLLFPLNHLAFVLFVTDVVFVTSICCSWPIWIQGYRFEINGSCEEAKFCFDLEWQATEYVLDYASLLPASLSFSSPHFCFFVLLATDVYSHDISMIWPQLGPILDTWISIHLTVFLHKF